MTARSRSARARARRRAASSRAGSTSPRSNRARAWPTCSGSTHAPVVETTFEDWTRRARRVRARLRRAGVALGRRHRPRTHARAARAPDRRNDRVVLEPPAAVRRRARRRYPRGVRRRTRPTLERADDAVALDETLAELDASGRFDAVDQADRAVDAAVHDRRVRRARWARTRTTACSTTTTRARLQPRVGEVDRARTAARSRSSTTRPSRCTWRAGRSADERPGRSSRSSPSTLPSALSFNRCACTWRCAISIRPSGVSM